MTGKSFELLTPAEMAEADRRTIAGGTPGMALMERAGGAVADAVCRHPLGARVVVVAGPGNNGGDGFVAARILRERDYPVRMLLFGAADRLGGDAAEAARRWGGPVEPASAEALGAATVIVDALFGAGLARDLDGEAAALVEAINAAGAHVVAVDLPSGIDGNSGAVRGAAVRASETITFFRRKPGHLLLPGRLHCGPVRVADIGIADEVLGAIAPRCFANGPDLWGDLFPRPTVAGHKYSRGHAVVVSGGLSTTGAARLAARGALRAGAGLVTIASPRDALPVHAASNLAVMVRQADDAAALGRFLADPRLNAVVIGPGAGVGAETRARVAVALRRPGGVVLDADALTSFAEAPDTLFAAIAARPAGAATVLTPHTGEFSRLFGGLVDSARAQDKLSLARAAAKAAGAIVLLKGADTVVAEPAGRAAIAENAPPWLATAGSGDVLAGFIAALLAQGMPGFEAAAAAVWLHGETGREAGPGLISEDLPETIPAVYRRLFAEVPAPR